ncbi:XrtA/PEP-CTERM system histidine kinase PrsK [Paracraurococcus lichenis]|uniref:histidine kinase n=1 Tax=Paracraurococcus lichenis TaxID=3064888 RepID=A0ABT9EAT9_9PROT|nr:XrtA/PEP-CTERM system histidine kinase PrsK [Paracraurococcus sp. LOR1-02]MDO9713093.1 PEP-CTERM system histidine kinase PrsK [Paracraurococcus sp. LOR1-02]
MTAASVTLHAGAAVVCLAWTVLVLATGRGRAARLLAAACGIAALWAAAVALAPAAALLGPAGGLEILRWLVWLGVLLFLFHRIAGARTRRLAGAALAAALLAAGIAALALLRPAAGPLAEDLGPVLLLARLSLPVLVVLTAENLFRTADEAERWHVGLPAIALGGLSAYDVLLYADAALSRGVSMVLLDSRAALTALVMPLLAIAAVRDGRWQHDPPVSRQVVFHGATLVVAGAFLLAIGALGEALRRLDVEWGATAQASLLAAALIGLLAAADSRSLRSRLRALVVDHFFTARYDYRREWLRCVEALSAGDDRARSDRLSAERRAIRAIADAVDSPAGLLLRRDAGEAGLRWAGSWNLRAAHLDLPADDPFLALLGTGEAVLELDPVAPALQPLRRAYGPLWLAVPLPHGRDGLSGIVLLAPPRAPFKLDREVRALLRVLGHEVAMFLAERRAAERLVDERRLQDYAKRFAFVAHDVKTVSSQLSLLLANAEDNLADPEFQHDMLLTVRAAAARIDALIHRLGQPGDVPAVAGREDMIDPLERLRGLAAGKPYPVQVEGGGTGPLAAIAPARFDTAVGHLMNNAAEASPRGEPVRVRVLAEGRQVVVEISDRGPGMTPEFIRDELFRPLSTSKRWGSGIGAWQARELLREAGGDLAVVSRPGAGTTMRLLLPAPGRRAA